MNYEHYKNIVEEVQKSVTDSVLTAAVNAMPKELDAELQEKTFQDLKVRRDQLSEAMDTYYNFSNRIVDIRGTNSKEFVSIKSLDERCASC